MGPGKMGVLILFPLMIIVVAIALQAGTLSGQQNITFCAANQTTNCITSATSSSSFYCSSALSNPIIDGSCKILPTCASGVNYSPAWCVGDPITAIIVGCGGAPITTSYASCGVWLPTGNYVNLGAAAVAASVSSTGGLFAFSAGASGFIGMIGVAVAIACALGLTVFGTSTGNTTSINVVYVTGLLLGIWGILISIEGFLSGNPGPQEMFTQLNNAFSGLGTFFFVGLTLVYVLGTIGASSMGGGGGV